MEDGGFYTGDYDLLYLKNEFVLYLAADPAAYPTRTRADLREVCVGNNRGHGTRQLYQ